MSAGASGDDRRGRLIVLSGPSGVGKDTVIKRLVELAPAISRPVAYTTRQPRPGERDGIEYSFITPSEFEAKRAAGDFLETATVHGNLYGTARERVERLRQQGRDVLLKIDVQGASQLRAGSAGALFIFLAPPSREVLRQRLKYRETESAPELATRTRDAERELEEARWYHHRVVNDEVDRAAGEIAAILYPNSGPDPAGQPATMA
ncbi:MAG TPA: guanylate kinase [Candidatus Nanopelagicaceae bacterium]|nr:guanylate kinase [Candidatus Nanopelagicaceae bacterium]